MRKRVASTHARESPQCLCSIPMTNAQTATRANELGFMVPDYNYDPGTAGIAKPNGLVVKQPFTPEVPQSFNAELVTQKDRLVYSY